MFTGIIKHIGKIIAIEPDGSNKIFSVESSLSNLLHIDQSVSHNGVCLTIIEVNDTFHKVCAIPETLHKSTANDWLIGDTINLETCLSLNNLLDGHIVQGHVDTKAICKKIIASENSWIYTFEIENNYSPLIIEKGSICINGISLTLCNVGLNTFDVCIIPYTYNNTNFKNIVEKSFVNIEFDVIGKYVLRIKNTL